MRPVNIRRWLAPAVAVVTVTGVGVWPATPPTVAQTQTGRIPFNARALVAVSDTDTVAQAYIDDRIGPPIGDRDTLTVITPGRAPRRVAVSNSVWGPPTTLVTTPDGRYSIVLEVKEQREDSDRSFENDLAFSTKVSVVDLRGPKPRVVQTTDTGGFAAHSLAISPRGDQVVVANWAERQQVSVMSFRNGRLGPPQLFGLDNIPGPFAYPNTVAWHPSGQYLAITVGPRNLVAFYRVSADRAGRVSFEPWGAPVPVGAFPFPGTWSPNGHYFIAGTMEWSEPDVSDRNSPPGSLQVVSFDDDTTGGVRHRAEHGGTVGINPEGLAISPDGKYLAAVNLRYSHLPGGYDPLRPPTTSSVSLATFDQDTGRARVVGEYTFDGVLPEGVAFDNTGDHLAVAVFDFNGAKAGRGAVQFWRLHRGDQPRLEQLDAEIPTARGTHSLSVIR